MKAREILVRSASDKPTGRGGHRLLCFGGNLWLVGGYNHNGEIEKSLKNIRCFSLAESKWLPVAPCLGEPSRSMASHCAASYGPFIIVHGGLSKPNRFVTTERKSLFAFDTRNHSWSHLDEHLSNDECPIGLYGHTMSIIDDTVYLVGGTSGRRVYSRSVFKFDLKKRDRWVVASTLDELDQAPNDYLRLVPRRIYRHECVNYGRFIFLFGGITRGDCYSLNNIHFFDTNTSKWNMTRIREDKTKNQIPSARCCHSVALYDSTVILQGGTDGHSAFRDIWTVDLNSKNESFETYHPSNMSLEWKAIGFTAEKCYYHASAADEANGTIYTFGGDSQDPSQDRLRMFFSMGQKTKNLKD